MLRARKATGKGGKEEGGKGKFSLYQFMDLGQGLARRVARSILSGLGPAEVGKFLVSMRHRKCNGQQKCN